MINDCPFAVSTFLIKSRIRRTGFKNTQIFSELATATHNPQTPFWGTGVELSDIRLTPPRRRQGKHTDELSGKSPLRPRAMQ